MIPLSELQRRLLFVILVLLMLFAGLSLYNVAKERVIKKQREAVQRQRATTIQNKTAPKTERRRSFFTPKWRE